MTGTNISLVMLSCALLCFSLDLIHLKRRFKRLELYCFHRRNRKP